MRCQTTARDARGTHRTRRAFRGVPDGHDDCRRHRGSTELDVEAVYKELASNLIRNSHFVAAGIVAVNRAQERGYAFANAG